jgi:surface antigen
MSKGFSVVSRTVAGSLLTACILISGCASQQPYYGDMSTAAQYRVPQSSLGYVLNFAKHNAYSVPAQDRKKHEQCVFFALDNLHVGESCDWFSQDNSARGSVAVIAHRPQGSGYCTTLYSSVSYKGKHKNFQETACKSINHPGWNFVPQ